jgi:SSS family solute:Na+ symporter
LQSYLRGNDEKKWWMICLSIMATQASAITFISTPGQAYESGMGFLQIYFGLPLAMIVISAVFIPRFYKLNVYTAYEYLEGRFNLPTRQYIAALFLLSRGLGAGITIYAPAIILSTIYGWNLNLLCLLIGAAVILYIYVGGEKAVNQTQALQMTVILSGMGVALGMLIHDLPQGVSLFDATYVAGKLGKMNVVNTHFDLNDRYTLWSGLLGGFFLSLSYFGTDQSQVSRYLGGESVNQSKLGLFFNGLVKIPMQFFILFIGVMTFIFFIFHQSPVFFNQKVLEKTELPPMVKMQLYDKQNTHAMLNAEMYRAAMDVIESRNTPMEATMIDRMNTIEKQDVRVRQSVKDIIHAHAPDVETRDTDYVFLTFVLNYLPHGLIGLLLAVMFCAAMSATAGQINSLASTTVIDYYKRSIKKDATEEHYVKATKTSTLLWGAIAVGFAVLVRMSDNLVQLVNELGSIFYGTILGVFLVAFFIKHIKGRAVFVSALISEAIIVLLFLFDKKMSYLWLNPIGALLVIVIGYALSFVIKEPATNLE